ncbi:hypothetical protein JW949_02285 [Candidatus Woesearchaeota archaeon]|nr:hypothetical protein [Candidatus Woesearchaeota archaeon]
MYELNNSGKKDGTMLMDGTVILREESSIQDLLIDSSDSNASIKTNPEYRRIDYNRENIVYV